MQSWLCPSDRQLRLRACIARGWATPRDALADLTPAECATIGDVLRRDRTLRQLDWGRVSRATEQVERLRLAQHGDGEVNCKRCGRRLRHVWCLTSVRCVDCGCRFCETCTTQLTPARSGCAGDATSNSGHPSQAKQPELLRICRLCRELRLLRAKSGAWFHPRYAAGPREPSPEPPASPPRYAVQSASSPEAFTVGLAAAPANRDSESSPEGGKMTSPPEDDESPWHPSAPPQVAPTNQRRFLDRKSLSHSDLPSYPLEKQHQHHGLIDRLHHLPLRLPLHLPLHMGHRHKGKSAGSLQGVQLQREYFPTELSDE